MAGLAAGDDESGDAHAEAGDWFAATVEVDEDVPADELAAPRAAVAVTTACTGDAAAALGTRITTAARTAPTAAAPSIRQ